MILRDSRRVLSAALLAFTIPAVLFFSLSLPTSASEHDIPIPAGQGVASLECTGPDCELCNLVELGNNVIRFIIFNLAVPVSALLFAYAGFLYLTSAGNTGRVSKAKSIFVSAFVGFVITLVGFSVVDLILKELVQDEDFFSEVGVWHKVECVGDGGGGGATSDVKTKENGALITTPPEATEGGEYTRAQATDALATKGITVNNPDECPSGETFQEFAARTGRRCTSLGGIKKDTVDVVLALQSQCIGRFGAAQCRTVVTGGTELGHSCGGKFTHCTGHKIDLRNAVSPGLSTGAVSELVGILEERGAFAATGGVRRDNTNYGPITIDGKSVTVRFEDTGKPNAHVDLKVVPAQ